MDSPEFVLERKVAQAHAMYQAEHAQLHKHDVGYPPGFPLEGKHKVFRNQSRVECLSKNWLCWSARCNENDDYIIIGFLN